MPYRIAPAPPPKIPDGPDYIGAAQRSARRNRRIGMALTAALAGLVVTALLVHRGRVARHRAAFDDAKLDLEACLVGPEPLPGNGGASCGLRVRRRQLMAMATPVERRIDEGLNGWPMRCSEATRRMAREAIELEDVSLQREADDGTRQLATMKALDEHIRLPLCVDASGGGRPAHASTAAPSSFPALAAPLDLDALVAHGKPSRAPLDLDPPIAELLPEGYRPVGSTGSSPPADPPEPPEGESLTTDRDWPGVIHTARCAGGKCQRHVVSRETFDLNDPALRASDAERFQAANIGGSIIAVWRAGARGGLRLRVAPIGRLATTKDVVVFDDLVRGGVEAWPPTLASFRLYGGTREARIFLVTEQGTWIVSVDEQGAFTLR